MILWTNWPQAVQRNYSQVGNSLEPYFDSSQIGYTESWIIPKPYFSACFHAGSVKKIRDNFSSLLSCFQYFFIGSFPTFGIIL